MDKSSHSFCLKDKLEFQRKPYYNLVKVTKDIKSLHPSSDEFEKSSRCSFSALPDEIILNILETLDWKSLCHVSRVNKRLNYLTRDHHQLYKYLDADFLFANTGPYVTYSKILDYFASRCKDLRLLNLSSQIEFSDLINFLKTCGRHLTHLRIRDQCINFNLSKIVEICQDLKELNLCYVKISDEEFLCLENLQFLECLDVSLTYIKTKTLCKILRRNRRIRHLHITQDTDIPYAARLNVNDVALELKNSCPNLEKIALGKTRILTSQSINAFADCKNLREVDFEDCDDIAPYDYGNSFQKLFSSCQRLEKIRLSWFRNLTDYDLEALTSCKNLKCLTVENVESLTTAICLKIFLNCPKLENLYITCDRKEEDKIKNLFYQWIEEYHLHGLRVHIWSI